MPDFDLDAALAMPEYEVVQPATTSYAVVWCEGQPLACLTREGPGSLWRVDRLYATVTFSAQAEEYPDLFTGKWSRDAIAREVVLLRKQDPGLFNGTSEGILQAFHPGGTDA